jgi:hypothetical protein
LGEIRNTYLFLVGNAEENKHLGSPIHADRKIILKYNFMGDYQLLKEHVDPWNIRGNLKCS